MPVLLTPRRWVALAAIVAACAWTGVAHASTFTVTTDADGTHGGCTTPCTMRDAILAANANPGSDTITFTVGSVWPQTPFPAITGPTLVDGTTAPGGTLGINNFTVQTGAGLVLAGAGITLDHVAALFFDIGVRVLAPGGDTIIGGDFSQTTVAGISVEGSSGNTISNIKSNGGHFGVLVTGASLGNHVSGSTFDDDYAAGVGVGPGADGTYIESNTFTRGGEGVLVQSANNVIGSPGAGNSVKHVGGHGITLDGPLATGNQVQGNVVGSDDNSGYTDTGLSGIYVGGPHNLVGGTTPGERNVVYNTSIAGTNISGGIFLVASGNQVSGNYVGVDETGTQCRANVNQGIDDEAGGNVIGGNVPGAGNLVSCSQFYGIRVAKGGDVIAGNFIGPDVTGTVRLGNTWGGIDVLGGPMLIGGTVPAARNVISGNGSDGIGIGLGVPKAPAGVVIQGNYIGLTAAGDAALPNEHDGINSAGAGTVVGGSVPGAGNVISGNGLGIQITAKGAVVQGNLIGTTADGMSALPNQQGVIILSGIIGGTTPAARNVISGNERWGVMPGLKTKMTGNYVGLDITGNGALPNGLGGVYLLHASGDTIGGTVAGAGNVISGNTGPGIYMGDDASATKLVIAGNRIGTNAAGLAAVPNTGDGILLDGAAGNTIGGETALAGNVIAGNAGAGIRITNKDSATKNAILGNRIGVGADGTTLIANGDFGIRVEGSIGNTIGSLKGPNVFAGNVGAGIGVFGGTGVSIAYNSFFATLGIDLAGDGATANDPGDADTGPDSLQNYPVLGTPTVIKGKATVPGTLDTGPGSYTIVLYSSPGTDSPAQGRTVIGTASVKIAQAGIAPFTVAVKSAPPAGSKLTAVAVKAKTLDTSELSASVTS